MSLAACEECWDTVCTCGHKYKNWSIDALKTHITMLQSILDEKLEKPKRPTWRFIKEGDLKKGRNTF